MSGGNGPDPYYQKDPPVKEILPKTYKSAVEPTRIEKSPRANGQGIQVIYYYECEHCGKEIRAEIRKKHKRAFCDKECLYEWQKYGKPKPVFSEKARKKMSETSKALWSDPEHRAARLKKLRKTMSSPEYRQRRSESAKEVASRPEWKEKQSKAHKGKKRPPEVGEKVSKAKMGHTHNEATREKLRQAALGPKSYFWKDGRSEERQKQYSCARWSRQRERVFARDKRICQGCGWTEAEVDRLCAHHIEPLVSSDFSFENYPDDLIVTLCARCHSKSGHGPGRFKLPINARGTSAHLERLSDERPWEAFIQSILHRKKKDPPSDE